MRSRWPLMLDTISTPSRGATQAKRKPNQRDRIKLGCRLFKYNHGDSADIRLGRRRPWAKLAAGVRVVWLQQQGAHCRCAWLLNDDKLRALRREARALTFDDIGLLIRLTDKDRNDCKAWRFIPWNVAPSERDAWLAAKRREQRQAVNRRHYQRKLDEEALPNMTEKRRDLIERMLKDGPQTLAHLTKRARRSPTFEPMVVRRRICGMTACERKRTPFRLTSCMRSRFFRPPPRLGDCQRLGTIPQRCARSRVVIGNSRRPNARRGDAGASEIFKVAQGRGRRAGSRAWIPDNVMLTR